MESFKQFLEAQQYNLRYQNSWLSPQGKFYPVSLFQAHSDFAESQFGKTLFQMFQEGWQRIVSYNKGELYSNNNIMAPNYKQLKALEDFAIEHGRIYDMYYDNDKTKQALWTKPLDEAYNNDDYVWDSTNNHWEPGISINIPTDFRITILKNEIDIENSSPQNPKLINALKQLADIRPDTINLKLKFDGYRSDQTLQDYISGETEEMPDIVYTGTSQARWEKIAKEGLAPRRITNSQPVYGPNKPSLDDRVYVSTTPGNTVKFAARAAARDGSEPIILSIHTDGISASLLAPDEDAESSHWKSSVHMMGTFAYRGIIKPQYIKPYMIWTKQEWRRV